MVKLSNQVETSILSSERKISVWNRIQIICYGLFSWAVFVVDGYRKPKLERRRYRELNTYLYHGKQLLTNKAKPKAIFIYAATVGELNAASAFISSCSSKWPEHQIIILAGREQYLDTYRKMYPNEIILAPLPPGLMALRKLEKLVDIECVFFIEGPS